MVATADSAILDRCREWVNLARVLVESRIPDAWIVDLSGSGETESQSGRNPGPAAAL